MSVRNNYWAAWARKRRDTFEDIAGLMSESERGLVRHALDNVIHRGCVPSDALRRFCKERAL